MPTKGELTRENILGIAEHIILKKGFSGTSIDEIIEVFPGIVESLRKISPYWDVKRNAPREDVQISPKQ